MRGAHYALMLSIAAASPAAADAVRHVPVRPPLIASESPRGEAPPRNRACVPVDTIAGAIVADERTVELRLKDGSRWSMRFAEACPALGFYQGFYYRRARAGYLCAGHDAVIARSGGECPIASLSRTDPPKRR